MLEYRYVGVDREVIHNTEEGVHAKFLRLKSICGYQKIVEEKEYYFLKWTRGEVFDPFNREPKYITQDWEYKKVRREQFDRYMAYLGLNKEKNHLHRKTTVLRNLEREIR